MHLGNCGWAGDATFTDLNQDGFPDLYVLNMQGRNHYFENQAGQGFVDKTASYFPKTPWGAMGIKFFDWNQDGLFDLFITDMHSDMTYASIKISEGNLSAAFEKQKSEAWCTARMRSAKRSLSGSAQSCRIPSTFSGLRRQIPAPVVGICLEP